MSAREDPELRLRREMAAQMKGKWRLTWHEDRHVNPGVPDASYVMLKMGRHQTGWLELKAIWDPGDKSFQFTLEPSQHRWIGDHLSLIPIQFLVAVGDTVYLVDSRWHERLTESMNKNILATICVDQFHINSIGEFLPRCLSEATEIDSGRIW